MLLEQGRFAAEQSLEDLERLHGVLLIALIDGLLENSNHGRDRLLEGIEGLGILLGLEEHGHTAQTDQGIDPDIGALWVLDGLAEEAVEVGLLAGERVASLLKCGPDDECSHLPVSCSGAGRSLVQVTRQISPLSVFEVLSSDRRNNTGSRVPGQLGLLV